MEALLKNKYWSGKIIKYLSSQLSYLAGADAKKVETYLEKAGGKKEREIAEHLSKLCKYSQDFYSASASYNKADRKWNKLSKFVSPNMQSYMDFGGVDGAAAWKFGQYMSLDKPGIIVVDQKEWAGKSIKPHKEITFVDTKRKEKIHNNSVDLITSFHVLHHVKDQKETIDFFNRVLTSNGIIILYEHDCRDKLEEAFLHVVHMMFDVIINKIKYADYMKTQYAKYHSRQKWKKMFSMYFKEIKCIQTKKIDNSYYSIFKRH
jgi:predicted SAM-dependent methyltransferase